MKKKLMLLLSMILAISMIPLTIFAETDNDAPNINPNVIVNSEGIIQREPNLMLGLSGDDVAKVIIEKSLNAIASKDPTGMAKWGVGKLIAGIFPKEEDTTIQDMKKMLEESIQRLEKLQKSVNKLSDQISLSDIYNHLNDYSFYVNRCITPINPLITTLNSYDTEADDPLGDDSQLAQNRRKVLTSSIGLNSGNMATINETAFDQNYYYFYSLITTKYKIDVSGQSKELDLFQMYREGMRYIYKWENQAWDDMDAYNVSVMSTFLSYATLRLESLDARKFELKASEQKAGQHDAEIDVINNETAELQKQVDTVRKLYEGSSVDRNAKYRYLWKPGFEAKFNTNLYVMNQVQENEEKVSKTNKLHELIQSQREDDRLKKVEKLVYECPSSGMGWPKSIGYPNESPEGTYNIWYDCEGKYKSEDMLNTQDYNNLLAAYDNQKSIGEILQEGEFKIGNDTFRTNQTEVFMINKKDSDNPTKLNTYKYGHNRCISEYNYYQPTGYSIASSQKAKVAKGKAKQFYKYRYFHMIDWIPETRKIKSQVWTIDDTKYDTENTPYVIQRYSNEESDKANMTASMFGIADSNNKNIIIICGSIALVLAGGAAVYGFRRKCKKRKNTR